jgi:hypothetical protein
MAGAWLAVGMQVTTTGAVVMDCGLTAVALYPAKTPKQLRPPPTQSYLDAAPSGTRSLPIDGICNTRRRQLCCGGKTSNVEIDKVLRSCVSPDTVLRCRTPFRPCAPPRYAGLKGVCNDATKKVRRLFSSSYSFALVGSSASSIATRKGTPRVLRSTMLLPRRWCKKNLTRRF